VSRFGSVVSAELAYPFKSNVAFATVPAGKTVNSTLPMASAETSTTAVSPGERVRVLNTT